MKVKKIIFLFIINLFNSIILPFSSNPDDLNLYFPTIEPLKMCTRHFVVDFSIFFWFPFFLSNLLLHPNHTVCKANVPEMITEDYISDVEEGIFIFLHFLICSFASFMLLSVCPYHFQSSVSLPCFISPVCSCVEISVFPLFTFE